MTEEPDDSTTGAATYVFCVVQAARAPSLLGAPPSLPGAGSIRLLAVDRGPRLSTPTRLPRWGPRLWAVVCDAPLSNFSGDRIEGHLQDLEQISKFALAHAAAIEFFFRRAPVVPLKLFTLFSSDERAVGDLRRRREKLKRLLKQVQGREEWGVRVTVAPEVVRAGSSTASGREYLETKKRQRDRSLAVPRGAAKTASSLFEELGKLASSVSRQAFPPAPKGRPLVAGASFLVPVRRRAAWKKRVAQASEALARTGSQLELTGPWPPYHFVTETRWPPSKRGGGRSRR